MKYVIYILTKCNKNLFQPSAHHKQIISAWCTCTETATAQEIAPLNKTSINIWHKCAMMFRGKKVFKEFTLTEV
jgi:hypothetical protein